MKGSNFLTVLPTALPGTFSGYGLMKSWGTMARASMIHSSIGAPLTAAAAARRRMNFAFKKSILDELL